MAQVKEDEERGRILRELQKHIRDIWNQLSLEQARRMWQKETVRRKVEVSKRRVWSMRTMAQQVDDGVTQLRSALTVWGIDEPKLFELLNGILRAVMNRWRALQRSRYILCLTLGYHALPAGYILANFLEWLII